MLKEELLATQTLLFSHEGLPNHKKERAVFFEELVDFYLSSPHGQTRSTLAVYEYFFAFLTCLCFCNGFALTCKSSICKPCPCPCPSGKSKGKANKPKLAKLDFVPLPFAPKGHGMQIYDLHVPKICKPTLILALLTRGNSISQQISLQNEAEGYTNLIVYAAQFVSICSACKSSICSPCPCPKGMGMATPTYLLLIGLT